MEDICFWLRRPDTYLAASKNPAGCIHNRWKCGRKTITAHFYKSINGYIKLISYLLGYSDEIIDYQDHSGDNIVSGL